MHNYTTELYPSNFSENLLNVEHTLKELSSKVKFLQAENKKCKHVIKYYEELKSFIAKMLHDIRSPLSSLQMISECLDNLDERRQIYLKSSIIDLLDITNMAFKKFKPNADIADIAASPEEPPQIILVSTVISEIINDRRLKHPSINFKFELNSLNAFMVIKAGYSDFKRAISNLINNAIDAVTEKDGEIRILLKSNEKYVYLQILDNGKGIPKDVLKQIKNNVSVTADKENGNGIGLMQVRDMLKNHHAKLEVISSQEGRSRGTTVELAFPHVNIPEWSINTINFSSDNTIIIFDTDREAHSIWNDKFAPILEKLPHIDILHFYNEDPLIAYLAKLPNISKQSIHLLCSLHMNNQQSCFDLIKDNHFQSVIAISNCHLDHNLKKKALELNFKILPKELIIAIPFRINQEPQTAAGKKANVHMVFLDDDKAHLEILVATYFNHLVVDQYNNPHKFLEDINKYPFDTKIILDNYYYYESGLPYNIDGISIAKKLHETGYTNLFLLSGELFDVPDYLRLILKTDKEEIKKL